MSSHLDTFFSVLVRTDADSETHWSALVEAVSTPSEDGFLANLKIVDEPRWYGLTAQQLLDATHPRPAEGSPALFIADREAQLGAGFPILVVDLVEGREPFRCVASELWGVENNLSVANLDWESFADTVDDDGVWRAF